MILLLFISLVCAISPELGRRLQELLSVKLMLRTVGYGAILLAVTLSSGCSLSPWRTSSLNSQQAQHWTHGGLEAIKKGRLNLAQSCFSKAMDHRPGDTRIQSHLAETFIQKGDFGSAIAQLEQATQSHDCEAVTHVRLGELYLENGQWIPAVRQAELALSKDRQLASAWVLKGRTEYSKGAWGNALANFQRALGYQPKNEQVQLLVADTYQKLDQPMRALATVEDLMSHYPANAQPEAAVIAKSSALMDLRHYQSAIDVLRQASEKDSATSEIFVRLGKAQLLAGQVSRARMTLNRGKQRFPDETELEVLVADLQSNNQDVAMQSK